MTKDEEAILDAYLSPHRLKDRETPARPQPETIDPIRERIAAALAARFREVVKICDNQPHNERLNHV